jgi:tetratricopeptide (TPR) repeat protein
MTGKEPITTYSYSYQSGQYQPKVLARVKKYFEKISNIPDELREPICQVIGDEISSIADYVTSERDLKGRMKDLPISQSSKIPVIDFLSSDLSTNESSRHFSVKAKELGKALEDGYTYYRRRKFREKLVGTIERSVNIGAALIGIVFVIAVAISALTSLNKPSGELPPMTRVSDLEMQYTDDEFDSEESEQHIEATQTAEAITSQITQASQHFSNAVDLHEQAETLTNTQESAIVYQESLDEYSDALTIFLAVLDDAEGFSAEYRGALCKVIYATTWNMSLVYEDMGRMQECLLHLEKASSYLKEGYELYPEETDDLPDLTRTYEKLGDLHLEQGSIDDSLDAYQKCISYLTNPSMPIEDSWFIVIQLESKIQGIMDRPNLTATQESRAQGLLVSLDEVGKGADNE